MNKIKVLIVEDELIIASDLSEILGSNNYEVCGVSKSFDQAIKVIRENRPDILLLDINIKGDKDGIQLASEARHHKLPFIFISSHTDRVTIERAKQSHPYGFLVKPFEEADVLVAIEMALANFAKEQNTVGESHESPEEFVIGNSLFVRHKNSTIKISYDDILFAQADSNYSIIHTKDQRYTLRSTLKELESKLTAKQFYRSHKSYLINLNHLMSISADEIIVGKEKLPVGREQHEWLMTRINRI
jgi:DNA-binding LytR/AlgR family response regulator